MANDVLIEIADLRGDMKALTQSISECVIAITKKEMSDHYLAESLKDERMKNVEQDKRISNLELASSGDGAMRRIFWIVTTVASTALISAIVYSVITK